MRRYIAAPTSGLCALSIAVTIAAFSPAATADELFYANKQLRLIVAGEAGGGFDAYARLVERHLTKFIPGRPTIIVNNMPGASGLTGTSYLYTSASRDGLTIGAIPSSTLLEPLYQNKNARYDPRRFGWLSSLAKSQAVCVTWHTSPIKTLDAAKDREVVVSATGAGGINAVVPKIFNRLFDTRFKVILGYTPNGSRLALENGEVEAICGLAYQTLQAASPDWFTERKLNFLAQFGLEKSAELPDVINALEFVSDPDDRQALELFLIPQEIGRPFLTPPDVPRERLELLRQAFASLASNQDFTSEASKLGLSLDILDGQRVSDLIERAYASPERVIAQTFDLRDMPLPPALSGKCSEQARGCR